MSELSVTPEDIRRKLEEIRDTIRQDVIRPDAAALRNILATAAMALAAAYLFGKSRGKRKAKK